ncbi:CoA ester lyase [Halobellus salinus]|uniref:CoA ester lyase n=1 Tax=Halobellus salinus TaxID=931585 RepID=A0A830EHL8_9EURY|nr:CoA ester lyase [Halobellus salinus]GGJ05874.1 CoA ester lyase [Halobellus salinus]SMP23930.1 citrate lyase subunit beta / citryl-CoA lyase [Halobellus salinus]
MVRRSLLYCPGDDRGMMETAVGTDADTVIFDLEDAVAPAAKDDARGTVQSLLNDLGGTEPARCVRINPYDRRGRTDVESVVGAVSTPPDAIALPKVDTPETVEALADHLADLGADGVDIVPLIETARGVVAVEEIAAAPGVDAVAYGDQDFTADIGATVTDDKTESLYARQRTVVAAAAAGVDAVDTVWTDIGDLEGLREQAAFAVDIGFDGKLAIHPDQVPVINDAFTPTPDQLEWAEAVLDGQDRAADADEGVFTVDGQMIDPPLVERARTVVERAEAAGLR